MCFVPTRYLTKIPYFTGIRALNVSPLDQQLLRFSPLLDHVTEITCYSFKSVQFDFDEENFKSGFGTELLSLFATGR